MLDYHAHYATLAHLRAALPTLLSGDPATSARVNDLLSSVASDPEASLMGAFVDQMVVHAASDGTELQLLETAAGLWTQGLALYSQMGGARNDMESALQAPNAPGAVNLMQGAINKLDALRNDAQQLAMQVQTLHATIAPLPHLTAHPRQLDADAKTWPWRDVFAGRRTDAFVRALFSRASDARTSSFAFGALSSYAANVAGSAFLGTVVGGPRRLHRYRDRLARNAVGAALHASHATPATSQMAAMIDYVGATGATNLPGDLASLLQTAFQTAYPGRTPPDMDLGFSRAVRHLRLLDVFQRPAMPSPPPLVLAQGLSATATVHFLSSDEMTPPGIAIPLDPDMQPSKPGKADSKNSGGLICLAILLVILTLGLVLLFYCIGKWSTEGDCDPGDLFDTLQGSEAPDPRAPTGITQEELTTMSSPQAAGHLAQELFNMHMLLWQGMDTALEFLAVSGLVYPDSLLMPSPLYTQFLTTPPRPGWPLREDAKPLESYHSDPSGPVEQPAAASAPLPPGMGPASFVGGASASHANGAVSLATGLLRQILAGASDSDNFDLDADRGFHHPCWDLAPGTSITAPVLAVEILPYAAQ